MSARDCSGAADVRSCTETADSGALDSFVTVPDTVTVAPGRATCGLTESITTEASLLGRLQPPRLRGPRRGSDRQQTGPRGHEGGGGESEGDRGPEKETRRGTLTGHA